MGILGSQPASSLELAGEGQFDNNSICGGNIAGLCQTVARARKEGVEVNRKGLKGIDVWG